MACKIFGPGKEQKRIWDITAIDLRRIKKQLGIYWDGIWNDLETVLDEMILEFG